MLKILLSFILLIMSEQTMGQINTKNKNKKKSKIQFVANEILVKFKSTITTTSQDQSIKKFGGQRLKKIGKKGLSHIKLPLNSDIQSALLDFRNDPDVEYAQPNYIYQVNAVPNDTSYAQQWGLSNTGQTLTLTSGGSNSPWSTNNPGTSGKDMKLEAAWDKITDCSSVVVAVLDTGINYTHEDLVANMWNGGGSYPNHGYDFTTPADNNPMDMHGHGTHVAGTIGAVGNNSKGTSGVCWQVKLMAVRVLDANGSGTSASLISGINFAVANQAKIINLSLGGSSFDQLQLDALTAARTAGVLVVTASGNETENVDDPGTPSYPCAYTLDNILCVTALDQKYALASYSNYGATSVDIAAPGTNIISSTLLRKSTITDSLALGDGLTGWSSSGDWGLQTLTFGTTPTTSFVNPSPYDYVNANQYANSANDTIWKTIPLATTAVSATLNFAIMFDLESNVDFVKLRASTSTGDPTASGTLLGTFTGNTGTSRYMYSYDVTPYLGINSTFGFNFTSNSSVTKVGLNISLLTIDLLTPSNVTYDILSGTSMATPHISGLAAMLFAYNGVSTYTYKDVINSIKNGGDNLPVLVGKTTTGKAANATNSLAFINAPTGGAATK